MPSRIIREGWLESDKINQLDASEERFFLHLCLRADDFGRYHANPVLLRSNLFPLREDIRSTDIPRWLAACEKAGLVRCYDDSGKRYVEIHKFEQRTRAQSSKFPQPPGIVSRLTDTCLTSDGHPRTETYSDSESNIGDGDGSRADVGEDEEIPYDSIVELYNKTCFSLPKASVTNERKRVIRTRWKTQKGAALAWFEELFRKTESSDFLTGRSGKWTSCNLDWIIKPVNATKILEGTYTNKPNGRTKQPEPQLLRIG